MKPEGKKRMADILIINFYYRRQSSRERLVNRDSKKYGLTLSLFTSTMVNVMRSFSLC